MCTNAADQTKGFQSNEDIELFQHFACRGSSHRGKGAARHTIELIWFGYIACLSQWGGVEYILGSNDFYLPSRRLEEGEGVSTLWFFT